MTEWKFRAAGVLGQGMVTGLFTTVRMERVDHHHVKALHASGRRCLYAFWHGGILPMAFYHQGQGAVVLVSEHADGEYITRVLERLGYETVRGSSTRGGVKGLRGLVRAARAGHDLAITPDGPRGPARVFKPGALVASSLTGVPIIPLGLGVSSAWHFQSWDRFTVPKPLSRVRIVYGEPVEVPRDLSEDALEVMAQGMTERMAALTRRAEEGLTDGVHVPDGDVL